MDKKEYLNLITDLPSAVAVLDRDLNYIAHSGKWLLDYDLRESVVGKNHYEVFTNIPKAWKEVHKEVLNTGIEQSKKADHFIGNDGSDIYISWVVKPFKDINGSIEGLIFSTENVTEENLLRRNLVEAQAVANIGSWNFSVINSSITWSPQMYEIFQEDISLGPPSFEKHKSTIFEDDVQLWESTVNNCIENGQQYNMSFRVKRSDGPRWVSAIGKARRNDRGEIIGLYGTCQDIHDDYIQQQKLKALNDELVSFSYRTSHDLKAPLTLMEGLINLSLEELEDGELQKQNLVDMSQVVDGLKSTIKSTLNIAKVDNIQILNEKLSVEEIYQELQDKFSQLFKDHQISLFIESNDDEVILDRYLFKGIIDNLVSNSIKFRHSDRNQEINVSINRDRGKILLTVKDNGQGIPKEYHEKVFNMFERFHNDNVGSGLGLYIVKKMVDRLQGEISFTSDDSGTQFIVSLKEGQLQK